MTNSNALFYPLAGRTNEVLIFIHTTNFLVTLLINHKLANFNLNLNENNQGQVQNPSLIFKLSRVTGEPDDPAIKFLGLHIDPSFNFKFHV